MFRPASQSTNIGHAGVADVYDTYPLSPLQQGMLFHSLSFPGSGVDIEQLVFTIQAPLDRVAFKRSWERVIQEHEILRTSFHWEGLDEPVQSVHRNGRLEFEEADWRLLDESERQARFRVYLEGDRRRDFDLTRQSLMRIALFQTGESEFFFVWTFHHALLDGRSFIPVLDQVYFVYESLGRGEDLELKPSRPYREYIDSLSQHDPTRNSEQFWRDFLAGANTSVTLPPVSPEKRSEQSSPAHDGREIRLSEALTSSLKSLASNCGVTLHTLLQAAWGLLLSRYSGEREIVFGTTLAGRRSAFGDAEPMVGFFINTVPMRVSVRNAMTIEAWFKEVRSSFVSLREHGQTPLHLIQQWSERKNGRPIFENILVFENYDLSAQSQSHWNNWKVRDFKLLEQTNYPLSLSGWSGEQLRLKIEYDRRRFDDETVSRALGHIETILEGMLTHSNKPIGSLPMLNAAERRQILVEWNDTATTQSGNLCVHRLFEARAASTPNAVAVVQNDARLTYGELNTRANQLAYCLQASGVGPETLVGILADRSPELIVSLLAVLKAGGAYVPLDPAYPTERLAAMIEDAGVVVILTTKHLRPRLPESRSTVICLDSDRQMIVRNSGENPAARVAPENLVYVIYTSGSTGKPKGVLVEHRSLANYVQTAIDKFDLKPADRVLQFASISFDTSAEEIYPCLARGGTLVLRNDSMLSSTSTFLRCCRDLGITVLDLPTAFWHELAASLENDALSLPPSIRLVIIGGERALPERVASWQKSVPSRVRLLNTYGPTEATIVATTSELSEPADPNKIASQAPVGRPIPNVRTYILASADQLVPIGVAGELHIAGAGLARGYLNNPALTAEMFRPDPFHHQPGSRMYSTGDVARYLSDGNIQLAGRVDKQVKINGFRIELGEIETALRSAKQVRDAIVLAREDKPGQKSLVAYVVLASSGESSDRANIFNQLRISLKKRLPHFMMPSAFVAIDALPLSPNGKVDLDKLPPPDSLQEARASHIAPRDPLERKLVELWEELLNIQPIGITDNFFDLGGHSLLTVRMMDRIEREFGKMLPLGILFEEGSVEHLAASLLEQDADVPRSAIVEVQKGSATKRPFFFLHGDFNGGGFYCLNLARGLGSDQPFFAVQPHGLDGGSVPSTIEAMAESQLLALRAFQPAGPYLLGGYCNGGTIAFEMARQLQSQGERIDLLVLLCSSARNARFKLLNSLVNGLSKPDRRNPEQRLERFLSFRDRVVRAEGIRNYYRARLTELSHMNRREKTVFFKEKSGALAANLLAALASVVRSAPSQAQPPAASGTTQMLDERRRQIAAAYDRALLGYVERPYRGRVTVFWPDELPLNDPNDPTAGWRKVATEVDVHRVPGGHITCVTSNIHNLARTLKVSLDKTHAAHKEPFQVSGKPLPDTVSFGISSQIS